MKIRNICKIWSWRTVIIIGFILTIALSAGNCHAQITCLEGTTVGCAPVTMRFVSPDKNSSNQWTVTDGTTTSNSVIDTLAYTFTVDGTYTLSVGSSTLIVTIYPRPTPNINNLSPIFGCSPFTFSLTDITTLAPGITITNWTWSFCDGSSKTGKTINHTITGVDAKCTVNLNLTMNPPSCSEVGTFPDYLTIYNKPVAKIKATDTMRCNPPLTTTFTNLSTSSASNVVTYTWRWSGVNGSGTVISPGYGPVTYTQIGKNQIILKAENQLGCFSEDTVYARIDTLDLQIKTLDTVCAGDFTTVELLNHSPDFYYSFSSPTMSFLPVTDFQANLFTRLVPASGWFPFTITKTSISDPTCMKQKTFLVYLQRLTPLVQYRPARKCGYPTTDTFKLLNLTKEVDSMIVEFGVIDKYGLIVFKDSLKLVNPDSVHTFTYAQKRLDQYYHAGDHTVYFRTKYKNESSNCFFDSVQTFENNEIFYTHLIADNTKGFCPLKVNFTSSSYATHRLDSVTYWIQPGNIQIPHKVLSPGAKHTFTYTFTAGGVYQVRAIGKSLKGCIDTSNLIEIIVNCSQPSFGIGSSSSGTGSYCASAPITFNIGASSFDQLYLVTPDGRSFNCGNATTFTIPGFEKTGPYKIRFIGIKNGARADTFININVTGPKFTLERDFKCSRRDSILFILKDTSDIRGATWDWDFGDGTGILNSTEDSVWKKYSADSMDYLVKVTSVSPANGCLSLDTTTVKIRKGLVRYGRVLFCQQSQLSANTEIWYKLEVDSARRIGYMCHYDYTWQFSWGSKLWPPITDPSPYVAIPRDTVVLTLTGRDVNGCEVHYSDTVRIIRFKNQFKLNKVMCYPKDSIRLTLTPNPNLPIDSTKYTLSRVVQVSPNQYNTLIMLNGVNDLSNVVIDQSVYKAEYYVIGVANYFKDPTCPLVWVYDTLRFLTDTTPLIALDSVCMNSKNQIYSGKNQIDSFSYRWYTNNNLQAPPDTNYMLQYQFPAVGNGLVKLVRQNRFARCQDSSIKSVYIGAKPSITFDNSFDTSAKCIPFTTVSWSLLATPPVPLNRISFKWIQKGTSNPYILNPATIKLNTRQDTIRLAIQTSYGCRDTFLIANQLIRPFGRLKFDRQTICRGDSINFNLDSVEDIDSLIWTYGDGSARYQGNLWTTRPIFAGHRYAKEVTIGDTLFVKFNAYAREGKCPIAYDTFVIVKDPKAQFRFNNGIDTIYCFGPADLINLSPRGDYFRWDLGDGNASTNRDVLQYQYAKPGRYRAKLVSYMNPLGCADSTYHDLILHPLPKLSAIPDTACLGDSLRFRFWDTLPGTNIYVIPDSWSRNPYTKSPAATLASQSSSFKLLSISDKGCRDSTSVDGMVVRPKTLLNLDTIIVSGKRVALPAGYDPFWDYVWSPPLANPSCVLCDKPEMQFIVPTTYNLTIKDRFGCFTAAGKYVINIFPDIKVLVPTAFSPNGDGNNDIMYARGSGIKKLLSFKIYNRLGQLLFVSYDENDGWDGKYNGVDQNSDPYFYTFEAESFIPGKIVTGEGNFMLVR